ncbi:hypothetical protein BCR33DRAFT_785549 [Rhizoclosmatium globosum]|uniref:Carbohydrate-binding module family 19 domain-containing protein n=1 Tax=Rhizoclosmatium globosum TaxID=329046 RepID=A0A1Y2C9K7_9FUNG|nr:hypothetical protein BCR33DRAFT_785549 [Rhizoclosmatium globosum]|eukprot:ORY43722.1 hypothetical protein BCR33DRAFT_785549 [Rhizoclosmatium globosum]
MQISTLLTTIALIACASASPIRRDSYPSNVGDSHVQKSNSGPIKDGDSPDTVDIGYNAVADGIQDMNASPDYSGASDEMQDMSASPDSTNNRSDDTYDFASNVYASCSYKGAQECDSNTLYKCDYGQNNRLIWKTVISCPTDLLLESSVTQIRNVGGSYEQKDIINAEYNAVSDGSQDTNESRDNYYHNNNNNYPDDNYASSRTAVSASCNRNGAYACQFNSLFHCGYVSKNGLTWTLVTTCPQNSICYAGGINGVGCKASPSPFGYTR